MDFHLGEKKLKVDFSGSGGDAKQLISLYVLMQCSKCHIEDIIGVNW